MTWFKLKRVTLVVFLNPFFLSDIKEGVRIYLSQKLFRWSDRLGGILLGWADLELLSDKSVIFGDVVPNMKIWTKLNMLLWCPRENELFHGKISSIGNDYIALQVFKIWNAVVHKDQFPKKLDVKMLTEGLVLQFGVLKLQSWSNLFSLEVSLIGEGVGIVKNGKVLELPVISGDSIKTFEQSTPNKKKRKSSSQSPFSSNIKLSKNFSQ